MDSKKLNEVIQKVCKGIVPEHPADTPTAPPAECQVLPNGLRVYPPCPYP